MTKTTLEVVTRAHRRMNMIGLGEDLPAEYLDVGTIALQGIADELLPAHGITIDITAVDDDIFLPLSDLLITELASGYGKPSPPRSAPLMRLRAAAIANDIVSDAEDDEEARAAYY